MKLLIVFTLLMSQFSFAETMKERRIKEEMLTRVDTLVIKVDEGREALAKEDVISACQKVEDLFGLLPKHLVSIGTKMNLFDKNVIKMERETKVFLIDMHMTSNICKSGKDAENLDMEKTDTKFKNMRKAFVKQKKRIQKSDTNYENVYNYYYEF
jgi:hypothetical protein